MMFHSSSPTFAGSGSQFKTKQHKSSWHKCVILPASRSFWTPVGKAMLPLLVVVLLAQLLVVSSLRAVETSVQQLESECHQLMTEHINLGAQKGHVYSAAQIKAAAERLALHEPVKGQKRPM